MSSPSLWSPAFSSVLPRRSKARAPRSPLPSMPAGIFADAQPPTAGHPHRRAGCRLTGAHDRWKHVDPQRHPRAQDGHRIRQQTRRQSRSSVSRRPKYTADRRLALVRELRNRLAGLPGVAAITSARPPDGGGIRTAAVSLNGAKPSPQNTQAFLYYTYMQPNYFQTLGIPLLSGRGFSPQAGQPEPSVILSQSAANQLWPSQNPIGRSLRLGTDDQFHLKSELVPDGPSYQVIGVARDTRGIQLDGSDSQQVYLPFPEDRLRTTRCSSGPVRSVTVHGRHRSGHLVPRSQPRGNFLHARPDAASNAAVPRLRSCG